MTAPSSTRGSLFLVLGATGGTGKHFVSQAVAAGHRVRALVRNPAKLQRPAHSSVEVVQGSISDDGVDVDALVAGADYVVVMVGDREAQSRARLCAPFVQRLVPSMRRCGVRRLLYQAGGLSRPWQGSLSPLLWLLRYTLARGFAGQHEDNEAVMEYLATQAADIEWMVHRAGIGGDGPSKGTLRRSDTDFSVGTHVDCADYNLRTVMDDGAVRTCSFSCY